MTSPDLSNAIPTYDPQGITQRPVVLRYPAGTLMPDYPIPRGVQCYAIWLASGGGAGFSVAFGIGADGPFIPFADGTGVDFGCAPINEGMRIDFAGVQTETLVIVYWPFYSGSGQKGFSA